MTISEGLKYGTKLIGWRDTVLILCHITEKTSSHIMLHEEEPIPNVDEFLQYLNRCKQGEPLQYVMGKWDFMGHTLCVDGRALIPRPETELLVEDALKFLQGCNSNSSVLDLCTGSGCIAIAIAKAGNYNVTAADTSASALSLAKQNGEGLNINFVQSNLFNEITGMFDLVVSNPPYITSKEMDNLSSTVVDHEPHLALHGGADGMDIYRKLIPQSINFLRPGGALFLEIGPAAVKDIMIESGYKKVQLKHDYVGLPRIVYGVNLQSKQNME